MEDEPDILQLPVALLSVVTDGSGQITFKPVKVAIVMEGGIIIDDVPSFPCAFVKLYGLTYALHLDYPKKLNNTFMFIQKLIMGLDHGKPLKPCFFRLTNDLSIVD